MRQSTLACCVVAISTFFACGKTDGAALDCPALDSCHDAGTYSASMQQCTHPSKPDNTPCAVATLCEGARVCQSGVCAPGEPVTCPQTQGCNLAVCNPNSGCAQITLTGPCDPSLTPVPLTGCTSGDYSAQVTLGTDQTFSMIIDSGSSTVAVASNLCSNCNGISPLYNPGITAVDEHQHASGAYGAASGWTGSVYNDRIALDGANQTLNINFVAISRQTTATADTTEFFTDSYCSGAATTNSFQGIFGLGNNGLNAAHTTNYLDALKAAGNTNDAFAVQLCDAGGNLWLGGFDPSVLTAEPQYTPLDMASGYYKVALQDILFGDTSLGLAASTYGSAVVDTGTSVVVVNGTVMQALSDAADDNTAFRSYFESGFLNGTTCVAPAERPTKAQLDSALPTMTWVFKRRDGTNFDVVMPATESYLTPQLLQGNVLGWCSGYIDGGDSAVEIIIGNSAMHNQVLIFDRAGAQLGFAPQNGCL